MNLELEDSLAGRVESVRPEGSGALTLYVCGPTVYDRAHVGHARTYLYFDVARRFFEAEGRRVRHVMNVTDIEDKIDQRAAALGLTWRALARREEGAFFRDLEALGIRPPTARPRASEFVPEMIEVARALERTGRVRRADEGWMYDAPPHPPGTNFLTGSELAEHAVLEPGGPAGPEPDGGRSFLVWKPQAAPRPSWPSPWGRGVPGWHLECYAMAKRFLRVPVDLHGGGRDLVYPHHFAENEIALALRGTRFSRRFFHTGFVLQGGAKMSKSTGELVPLRTALAAAGPGAVRWYLLGTPPLERLDWDARELARSREEYERLRARLSTWLGAGAGGRTGGRAARKLERDVRRDLARGLRTDRAVERLRRFSDALGRDRTGRVARGERAAARHALRAIESRTGIPLV